MAELARQWLFTLLWAVLPLVAGPAFDRALHDEPAAFRTATSIALWAIWAVTLVAALVPRTLTLTAIRIVTPAALVTAAWATIDAAAPAWQAALALVSTALATVVALSAPTGWVFVNGSAYGAERRFPLRPPGPLLLGPIELAWLVCVAGAITGPLLVTRGVVAGGIAAVVVGWPVAALAARALHRLSARWLVFVPAGMVLVDPMTLGDALLMQRQHVAWFGPATEDEAASAEDLTAGALGLALHARFRQPLPLLTLADLRAGASRLSSRPVDAVLFAPTRPGAVLREAAARHLLPQPRPR